MSDPRDHGGGLDAAIARYGGARAGWVDLSTGINPVPYPLGEIGASAWTALPDEGAMARLEAAARRFWHVPEGADLLAAPGASALIARLPAQLQGRQVQIAGPTYNEHAAAFVAHGWRVTEAAPADAADAQVLVHPNNPDGRLWRRSDLGPGPGIIDESFCDICPDHSLIAEAARPGRVVLKSFGKFWGLAGLRLGFAIGDPAIIDGLRAALGPWPVSGPALEIGARALADHGWAEANRARLANDAQRLDALVLARGAELVGGTPLFRLFKVDEAPAWQARLARGHVWSRIFPYSPHWLRLGLPAPGDWEQVEAALA